jgi:mannosyltransferase
MNMQHDDDGAGGPTGTQGSAGTISGLFSVLFSGLAPQSATLLLTVLGAALRFSALTAQSFWYDEAVSVNLARHSLLDLLTGRARDLGNPPLYPALLHVWMGLFGESDGAVRALSALLGTATIPVVVILARQVFPARVAFLGGTLLAVSPFHLQMAQEARAYTLLAFLGAVSALALVRATQEPARWPRWLLLAVSTAAMVLTHYFGAFLALGQAAYLLVAHRRDRAVLARAAGAYVVAALLFAFWLPAFFAQVGVEGNLARSAESWHLHLVATPLVFSLGTTLVWKDAATVPRLVLGGAGALAFVTAAGYGLLRTFFSRFGTAVSRRNPRVLLLLLWLVVPVAMPALISAVASPLYNTRYVILASLPFLLFAAAGIVELPQLPRAVVAGVMVMAMGGSTVSYLRRPVKHQWREAAAFVEAARRPTDLLIFEADYNETSYAHYAGTAGKDHRVRLMAPPAGEAQTADGKVKLYGVKVVGAAAADVSAEVAAQQRVWLILADGSPEAAERVHTFLAEPAWKARPLSTMRGITVQLFERP